MQYYYTIDYKVLLPLEEVFWREMFVKATFLEAEEEEDPEKERC